MKRRVTSYAKFSKPQAKNTNAPKGSSEQKVGDYYATCMDEAKIEADGLKPLEPEFARIAKIDNQKELLGTSELFLKSCVEPERTAVDAMSAGVRSRPEVLLIVRFGSMRG